LNNIRQNGRLQIGIKDHTYVATQMLDKEDFTRFVERIAKLLLQKDSKNKQKYNLKDNNC